ncbi:MAG: class I SAM-dependent methyltransferase [Thermoguttaceae bacterium]
MDTQESARNWQASYYGKKGADRNDLRINRGVLFQVLAWEASIVRAAYAMQHDPQTAKVLDVGCGAGAGIAQLLRLNYSPDNFTGIDVLPARIAAARRLYPQINLIHGDACCLDVANDTFDLVFESTMFAVVTDDDLSMRLAREMVRVCKPDGYLLLVDWRIPNPRDPGYRALTKRRLSALFGLGKQTHRVGTYRGALVPPLGRLLSKWFPAGYFLVAAVFPFLVWQVAHLLRKNSLLASKG